jgi:hypothetical protein
VNVVSPSFSPRPFSPGNPRWARSHIYTPPPVIRAGPVFALVLPTSYVVHVPAPNAEPHVQAHNVVVHGTEIILVLIVFVMVAGQMVVRVVRASSVGRARPA